MSLKRASVLVPVLLFGLISSSDAQVKLTGREKVAPAQVKSKLAALRTNIAKKKLRYKVGYTTAMDFKISDLARTKPPPDLPQVAAQQNAKASGLLSKYKSLMPKAQSMCDPNAKTFDWKAKGKMTSIRNQGSCGSCWSFTGSAAFEGSYNIVNSQGIDVSEQNVLDCAQTKAGKDAGSCSGGWYSGVFDHFMSGGAVPESSAPYKGKEQTCSGGAGSYHAAAWGYVTPDGSTPTLAQMKDALCKYGPLATTVFVTDPFMAYAGGVFEEDAPVKNAKDVNHGITLVGWDDVAGAYLIKNSWGTGWGESGYMRIAYGSNNVGYGAAWVLASKE